MTRRSAPAEQGKPTSVTLGDVAELLADHDRRAQVMLGADEIIKAFALVGGDESDAHVRNHLALWSRRLRFRCGL